MTVQLACLVQAPSLLATRQEAQREASLASNGETIQTVSIPETSIPLIGALNNRHGYLSRKDNMFLQHQANLFLSLRLHIQPRFPWLIISKPPLMPICLSWHPTQPTPATACPKYVLLIRRNPTDVRANKLSSNILHSPRNSVSHLVGVL